MIRLIIPIALGFAVAGLGPISATAGEVADLLVVDRGSAGTMQAGSWKERTISPVANMLYFEDPVIHNEIRPVFMYHRFSDDFFTGGGDGYLAGVQIRLAITEKFQVIVNKGGYLWVHPEIGSDSEGFGNLVVGAKYNLIDNEEDQFIFTPGFTYEIPMGDEDILHGTGDGVLHLFASAAKGFGNFHLTGQLGWKQALDTDANSSFLHYNLQGDFWIDRLFIPFVAFSGWTVVDAGNAFPLDSEGYDTINFGASDSQGVTQGTLGLGFRSRLADNLDLGFAWQKAIINPKDLYDDRFVFDMSVRW